jgi:hypothetical protein
MLYRVLNVARSRRVFYDAAKREVSLDPSDLRYVELDYGTHATLSRSRDFIVQPAHQRLPAYTAPLVREKEQRAAGQRTGLLIVEAPKPTPATVPRIAPPPPDLVLAAPTQEIAIIVGGAECWQSDFDNARRMLDKRDVRYFYVNDHIKTFDHRGVAITLHPDKLKGHFDWLGKRRKAGLPDPDEIWAHRRHANISHDTASQDWRGSSGLFAVQVARRKGHHKIIACGVPMTVDGNHFERRVKWQSAIGFRAGWLQHKAEIAPYFRSMSGWTREIFGAPDDKWLGG